MAYSYELESGQRIDLDNQGDRTIVTLSSRSSGQQQQASSTFTTGKWTCTPEILRRDRDIVIKITTAEGEHRVRVHGNSIAVEGNHLSSNHSRQMHVQQSNTSTSSSSIKPMEPIKPMKPMEPMKMGDMSMNMNPMEMRMGNMSMQMGGQNPSTRRFCSQCGTPVESSDRFCSSCGHQLL